MAMALLAATAFLRRSGESRPSRQPSTGRALLALGCLLVLLFPVVSASDDLHPTQALLEDATKRVQQLAAPLHNGPGSSPAGMMPTLLTLFLLCLYLAVSLGSPAVLVSRPLDGCHLTLDGRSPPVL